MTDYNPTVIADKTEFNAKNSDLSDEKPMLELHAVAENNYDKFQNETLKNKEQNRLLRKEFAYKAYKIAVGCLVFWAIVVAVNMGSKWCRGDALFSDTALGIITTGTTVNVFAALLTVIKGLFTKIDE